MWYIIIPHRKKKLCKANRSITSQKIARDTTTTIKQLRIHCETNAAINRFGQQRARCCPQFAFVYETRRRDEQGGVPLQQSQRLISLEHTRAQCAPPLHPICPWAERLLERCGSALENAATHRLGLPLCAHATAFFEFSAIPLSLFLVGTQSLVSTQSNAVFCSCMVINFPEFSWGNVIRFTLCQTMLMSWGFKLMNDIGWARELSILSSNNTKFKKVPQLCESF